MNPLTLVAVVLVVFSAVCMREGEKYGQSAYYAASYVLDALAICAVVLSIGGAE